MLARLQSIATRLLLATPSDRVPVSYSDPRIRELLHQKRPLDAEETSMVDQYLKGGSRQMQDEHRVFSAIVSAAASLRISADADGSSPMQHDIMAAVILSVLRWIYRDSWSRNREEILAFHGLERSNEWTVVVAGRRVGKSAASAAALAAILAFIPGKFYVRIYAQGLAIAKVMLRDIHDHIQNIPNKTNQIDKFVESDNRPYIKLVDPANPSKPVIVVAYPSGSDNNRGGVNPHAVVIDEALAVKEQTMKIGVLPLLLKRNTAALFISSPYDKPRCITELVVNLRHPVTHEQFCRCIIVEQRCHTCRLQGRFDCPHALEMRPSWIDPERDSLLQQLLTPGEFKQEILGITPFTVRPAFNPDHLDRFQKTNVHFIESVDVVFVFIDPSGGGASATGICSCLYTLTGMCMVGDFPDSEIGHSIFSRPQFGSQFHQGFLFYLDFACDFVSFGPVFALRVDFRVGVSESEIKTGLRLELPVFPISSRCQIGQVCLFILYVFCTFPEFLQLFRFSVSQSLNLELGSKPRLWTIFVFKFCLFTTLRVYSGSTRAPNRATCKNNTSRIISAARCGAIIESATSAVTDGASGFLISLSLE
jgi:hypothetical protein